MTVTLCELEAMAQWNSWFIELKDGDFPVQKYCKHVCQRVSIWKHQNKYWIILVCFIGSVRKWGIHPPKTAQTDMKKDASDKLLDSGVVPLFYSETPKHSLVEKNNLHKKKKKTMILPWYPPQFGDILNNVWVC